MPILFGEASYRLFVSPDVRFQFSAYYITPYPFVNANISSLILLSQNKLVLSLERTTTKSGEYCNRAMAHFESYGSEERAETSGITELGDSIRSVPTQPFRTKLKGKGSATMEY